MPNRRSPIEIQALALVDVIQFFAIVTAVLLQVLPPLPVHALHAVGPPQAIHTFYGSSTMYARHSAHIGYVDLYMINNELTIYLTSVCCSK